MLLAVDYSVLLFHGRDHIQKYLLTFMNIVSEHMEVGQMAEALHSQRFIHKRSHRWLQINDLTEG